MIFAGIITGISLTIIAVIMMAACYEYGKRIGYINGVESGKKIFCNFKDNNLEYVAKEDLYEYLDNYLDDEGNPIPGWYPLLIVKPESMGAGIEVSFKGE